MGLIQDFLDYTKDYESPTEFFYWSIVAGIGAALRDNTYLLQGDSKLYPNLYVFIVGKPAIRKAKPLNSTIKLVKHVGNTKVIEGRTSVQAVIQRLGETERNRKTGNTITGASGFIYSEEIAAMFTEDDATIPTLTDIYDFKEDYTSALVTRGTTQLTNVVVSLLGASNEELLKSVFSSKAIYGGLLSRCLIVHAEQPRHRNSLMYLDKSKFDPSGLQRDFKLIGTLKGIFQMTKEAREYYHNWYLKICPELESNASITGAEGRLHTNVLKVAMILGVSRTLTLEMDVQDVEEAIFKVQGLFVNYKRLTLGSGKSKDADPQVKVLETLWRSERKQLTRRELLGIIWQDVNDETLDSVLKTFNQGGLVTIIGGEGTQVIKLSEKALDYFKGKDVK